MGENHFSPLPTAVYGVVLLSSAIAYTILQNTIVKYHRGHDSTLAEAVGRDIKGKASLVMYLAAIPLAFVNQWISDVLYIAVAILWLIPDPRIERVIYGHLGEIEHIHAPEAE